MNDEMREFLATAREFYETVQDLHDALLDAFPESNVSYSTVTRELRKGSWSENARHGREKRGRPVDHEFSALIRELLEKEPNLSLRQIGERLGRPASSVSYHLTHVLGFKFKKTRWIPHELTDKQREARVNGAKALLDTIDSAKRNNFHFFVTGDESWFF